MGLLMHASGLNVTKNGETILVLDIGYSNSLDSDEMIRFLSNSKWEGIDDIKIKLHIDKYKNPCSHINLKIKCHKCCRNMGNGRLKDSYY
jgi:hypothetical protein